MSGVEIAKARTLFDPEPGWLNTASYGLPPWPAWDALQEALADWRVGRGSWPAWGEATGHARTTFARLVGADAADVSTRTTIVLSTPYEARPPANGAPAGDGDLRL